MRAQIKAERPRLTPVETTKALGEQWRALNQAEKDVRTEEAWLRLG